MKTFTLRLTDVEAEALERLAVVDKISQNQAIKQLICKEYLRFDDDCIAFDNELDSISDITGFPHAIERTKSDDHIRILRAAKWVLDNHSEEMTEKSRESIDDLINKYYEEAR